MKFYKSKKDRRGVSLVMAIVMVIILALTGIGLIQLGRNARMQAVRDVMKISARAAADAGIEHAVQYMIDGWNGAAIPDDWLLSWNDSTEWTDPAIPATPLAYSFGPVDMGGTYGEESFMYKIYKGTRSHGYQIVSTGTAGDKTSVVHAAAVLRSVFFGIGAKREIYLSPGTELGTVPDGETMKIQSNDDEPDTIILKPNITVPGDVNSGPGSDPEIAINLAKNSTIEGEAAASEDYIDFPPVEVPAGLVSLPYELPTIDASDPTVAYIYDDIKLDNLLFGPTGALAGVDTIYIGDPLNEGEVNIFVYGETYIDSNSRIVVIDGSSMNLYLGGDLNSKPGAEITYSDIASTADPSDEFIIEAATSISLKGVIDPVTGDPLCTEIHFYPKDDFYGTIYAPDADPLYLAPNGDFYGAIVGADNITIKPGGKYMFIPSLVDTQDVEVLYMGIKKGSWWEE